MNKQKILLIVVFLLALTSRISYEVIYADMYSDKVQQISAAKSLIEGKGFSQSYIHGDTLEEYPASFLTDFPPGYSLLIAFCFLFFKNFFIAGLFIDICSVSLLLLALYKILNILKVQLNYRILLFIFLTFSYTPFFHLNSTDLISLTILQWVFYYILHLLENKEKKLYWSIIIGVLLFLTGFFRYSYYPIILLVPTFFFVLSFIEKDKFIRYFSLVCGSVSALLLICQLVVMKILSGTVVRELSDTGFFLENIKRMEVFPFKSFFFYEGSFERIKEFNALLYSVLFALTIVFSLILMIRLFKFLKSIITTKTLLKYYTLLGLVLLVANVLFLSYMSLTHREQSWQNPPWTFVEETRYYSPAILFIQVMVFSFFMFKNSNRYFSRVISKIFMGIVMLYTSFYYVRTFKKTVLGENVGLYKYMYEEQIKISKDVQSFCSDSTFTAFASADLTLNSFVDVNTDIDASISSAHGFLRRDKEAINKKMTIIVAVKKNPENLIVDDEVEKIAEYNTMILYKRQL